MSAVTVYQGLEECFRRVAGPLSLILGDPTTIQNPPCLITAYASLEETLQSNPPARNVNGATHVFSHRLAIKWQDNPQAEMQLLTLIGSIPAAVRADPHLGGRLNKGMARITSGVCGYAEYSKETFRIVDYVCTVLEKEEAT